MLLFRSEEHIPGWSRGHGLPVGQVLSINQVWRLSRLWYGDRLAADYNGRTPEQAEAIFLQVGLKGPFWSFDN